MSLNIEFVVEILHSLEERNVEILHYLMDCVARDFAIRAAQN